MARNLNKVGLTTFLENDSRSCNLQVGKMSKDDSAIDAVLQSTDLSENQSIDDLIKHLKSQVQAESIIPGQKNTVQIRTIER